MMDFLVFKISGAILTHFINHIVKVYQSNNVDIQKVKLSSYLFNKSFIMSLWKLMEEINEDKYILKVVFPP